MLCVPTGITDVERRAVVEATIAAGARQAYLIEEPLAVAIGAGLQVAEPRGTLIVDIRGGTSEVAVIALGASVVLQSRLLRRITLTADEVRAALAHPLAQIIETVTATLEQTPPELAADLSERGLVLVGGGALLRGIDERLRAETQLPVFVADSPLTCVAVGAGQSLEELHVLEQLRTSADGDRRRRRGTFADRSRAR